MTPNILMLKEIVDWLGEEKVIFVGTDWSGGEQKVTPTTNLLPV